MDYFVGQILLVPYNFAPRGFAFCNGQLLSISQNTALFSLLGTQYGGDGKSNFALPNLLGRVMVGVGQGPGLSQYTPGTNVGTETVSLVQSQMPVHSHNLQGLSGLATTTSPADATFAVTGGRGHAGSSYVATGSNVSMNSTSMAVAGSGQSHNNLMPYLVLNYVIALTGIFPQRS